jgi:hypothetical protein
VIRKIVLIIVLGLPPLLLMHWNERHHSHAPKWLLLLSAAPLAIALMLNDDGEEPGPVGNFLLFVLGLFGIGVGLMGFALRDAPVLYGMGRMFIWMVPIGLIMAIVAVIRGLRD